MEAKPIEFRLVGVVADLRCAANQVTMAGEEIDKITGQLAAKDEEIANLEQIFGEQEKETEARADQLADIDRLLGGTGEWTCSRDCGAEAYESSVNLLNRADAAGGRVRELEEAAFAGTADLSVYVGLNDRIAAMERELAEARELNDDFMTDRRQLKIDLAEAKKDTARLDWLDGGPDLDVKDAIDAWWEEPRLIRAAIDKAEEE